MSTADFNQKRNELIVDAYRCIGVTRAGATISAAMLDQGIKALNMIMREEDAKGMGEARNFWAFFERHLKIQENGFVYSTTDGLANDIQELFSVFYRDESGDDIQLDLITAKEYEAIADKNAGGDPEKAYLKRDKDLSCQLLYIWPAPTSIATASQVTGSDGENYFCVMGHTSEALNYPVSGTSYRLYWDLDPDQTSSFSAWATATDYTGGNAIRYVYKRALYDFDNSNENPDMPSAWVRYLKFRLAYDLSWDYHLTDDIKRGLKAEYLEAFEVIFPQTKTQENSHHNKAMYF